MITINPVPTQSVRRTRDDLADQLYRQLKESIVLGIYRPGDRFRTVAEWSESLGISAKTVHTATGALRAEGLLVSAHAEGTSDGMLVAEPPRAAIVDVGELYLVEALEKLFRLGLTKDEVQDLCERQIARWYAERQGDRRVSSVDLLGVKAERREERGERRRGGKRTASR